MIHMFWNAGRNDHADWPIVPMCPASGDRDVLDSPLDRFGGKGSMAAGLIFRRKVRMKTCHCCQCL